MTNNLPPTEKETATSSTSSESTSVAGVPENIHNANSTTTATIKTVEVAPKKKPLASVDCAASLAASAAQKGNAAPTTSSTVPSIPMLPYTLQQQVQRAALSLARGGATPMMSSQGMGSHIMLGCGANLGGVGHHNTVAEFLYQLTKMLTDDNKSIIEWSNGRIEVHDPPRLADEVLHRYFRHSKYASFQRQLNYFGFRKLAGKGKMSPCSYVNDEVTDDLRSLLTIKRKTSATKSAGQKRDEVGKPKHVINHIHHAPQISLSSTNVHPAMGFINETNKRIKMEAKRSAYSANTNYSIGKGINHGMDPPRTASSTASITSSLYNSISNNNESMTRDQNLTSIPTVPSTNSLLAGMIPSVSSTNSLLAGLPSVNSMANFLDIPGMTPSTSSASLSADSDYVLGANISSSSLATDVTAEIPEDNANRVTFNESASKARSISFRGIGKSSVTNLVTRDSSLVDLAMLPINPPQRANESTTTDTMGFIDFPNDINDTSDGF